MFNRVSVVALMTVEAIQTLRVSALCKCSVHATRCTSKMGTSQMDRARCSNFTDWGLTCSWANVANYWQWIPRFLKYFLLCKSAPVNIHHWLMMYIDWNLRIGAMVAEVVNTSILTKNTSGKLLCGKRTFSVLSFCFDSCFIRWTCHGTFWGAAKGRLQFVVRY